MAKQIRGVDIIEKDHLNDAIQSAKTLTKQYKQLDEQIVKTAKDLKKIVVKGTGQSAKEIKQLTGALSESELKKRAVLRIDKERQTLEIQLKALNSQKIKQNDVLKRQARDQAKINKLLVELDGTTIGSLKRLRVENKLLAREKENVNRTTKAGAKRIKEINRQLDRNNAVLEKNASKLGKQKIGIGRYNKAIQGLRSSLAQLGLAFGVFALFKNTFKVIKDFDQAQANLSSVLGVTRKEMSALTEQAKELGATTEFTASQISGMQKEFAKLGFTQKEIENVTEATLQLAAAAGVELAQAAEVVGSTLRAFGLDTTETQRVVDLMAKSFSSSSLDMEKFAVAMRSVAPVAKNAGLSIERTTALLGTLTDRGIDASTAGTGLRNVFLELAKRGITFEEAMQQINSATDKNAKALELFGKRGAVVGTILAETGADVTILEEKLLNAGGAAEEMADKQLDTLGGAIKLLKSAWEGLILSFDEGTGAVDFLKTFIKFLAENLVELISIAIKATTVFLSWKLAMKAAQLQNTLFGGSLKKLKVRWGAIGIAITAVIFLVNSLINAYKDAARQGDSLRIATRKVNEELNKEKVELQLVFKALARTTRGTKEREKALDDVNEKYGLTLQNLEDEGEFVRQLTSAYKLLVFQLRIRIGIRVLEEQLVSFGVELLEVQRGLRSGTLDSFQRAVALKKEAFLIKEIALQQRLLLKIQEKQKELNLTEDQIEDEEDLLDPLDKNNKKLKERNKDIELMDRGLGKVNDQLRLFVDLLKDGEEESSSLIRVTSDFFTQLAIKQGEAARKEREKRIEELKKFRDESLAIIKQITDGLAQNIDKRIEQRQREIEESTSEIARLENLKAQGNIEAAQAIKAEKIAIAKEKLEIEALQKKKRNLLIFVVGLERASQLIGSGDGNPFKNAKSDIEDFFASLSTNSEGTDYNVAQTLGAPQKSGKDGYLGWMDGEEKLLSVENSRKLSGMHQDEVTRRALAYENNVVSSRAMKELQVQIFSDYNIVKELQGVKEAVKKIEITNQHFNFKELKEIIVKGNKTTINDHNPDTFRI